MPKELTVADRVGCASAALRHHSISTSRQLGFDVDTTLVELLTDLMHWCDTQENVAFTSAMKTARMHYRYDTLPISEEKDDWL